MSYSRLTILVCATISSALAGCTVQSIEPQPLPEIRTEAEQAYRHETGQDVPHQLPLRDRMGVLLDSALERAHKSPCDNEVVFYRAARWGWTISCDSCKDYSGDPWFLHGVDGEMLWDELLAELKATENSGLRRRRYVRYSELMEEIGVCPLPPDDSARRICLERAGWVPPLADRKWRGESWVVCE